MADKNQDRPLNIRTIQDERILEFRHAPHNLELPLVGVFDAPTRCYTVNHEWAKIIMGAVSLLLEVSAWPDAEHEDYVGIREIQKFLEGHDCMDCNDIEACLATSPIILALQNEDINLQNQIDSNDADILALQNKDTDLQNQISSNDIDILALQNKDTDLQSQITFNDTDISALQGTVGNLQSQIISNDNELADHESRITTLENSGGGGSGGGDIIVTPYIVAVGASDVSITSPSWVDIANTTYQHTFTYDKALIVIEFRAGTSGVNATGYVRMNVDGVASDKVAIAKSPDVQSLQVNDTFVGLEGVMADIKLQGYAESGKTLKLLGEQNIMAYIIEYGSVPAELTDPVVTFDAGGAPYTLASGNIGIVAGGGNPNLCLLAINVQPDEEISIEIDLGASKQIDGVSLDSFSSNFDNIRYRLWVDGVSQGTYGQSHTANTWDAFSFWTGLFPLTGQVIKVAITVYTGSPVVADLRMDNVFINTGGI